MKTTFIKAKKVNLIGIIIAIPIILVIIFSYWMKWADQAIESVNQVGVALSLFDNAIIDSIITIITPVIVITIGIIVHELIHGAFILLFTKNKNKLKFGFNKEAFVPYAHCKVPLIAWQMLIVALAPGIILGLIPFSISLINGNVILWFIGFAMILGAIGDFIYAYLILKIGLNKKILDHPSEVGFIVE